MLLADFAPLGGSCPDCAIVGCAAMSLYEEGLSRSNVIIPCDVLDVSLAILCAPLVVTHTRDLHRRRAYFHRPFVSLRMRSIEPDVLAELKNEYDMASVYVYNTPPGLSVTLQLDASVTEVSEEFMLDWKRLRHMDLRRTSVQRIAEGFLDNCEGLLTLKLPDCLTEIADGFTYQCRNLTSIELPAALTDASECFINECDSLERIHLQHTSLRSCGDYFLADCQRLSSVTLPRSLTEIKGGVLSNCVSLETLDLRTNTSLTRIGSWFLGSCKNLTSVHMPDSLTEILGSFLESCITLRCIDLRHTALVSIGDLFAAGCCRLNTVYLPDSVATINDEQFLEGCGEVADVQSASRAVQNAVASRHTKVACRDINNKNP